VQRPYAFRPLSERRKGPSPKGAVLRRGGLSLSGGDCLLSEEDFGLHTPAIRAFKLVHRKVAARWMLLDGGEPYWLAASRAGIVHKEVKRHGGVLCELRDGGARATVELFAGKNLGNALLLANPFGGVNSRQEGKLAHGL
jgi:hypothetical protein